MTSTPVSTIRNFGPALEAALARVGILDAESLREIGADKAYARLLDAGERPHFIGYYVMVMGLQGRPWNDCQGAEKAALRERFDALKDDAAQRRAQRPDALASQIEAALDALGVGTRR